MLEQLEERSLLATVFVPGDFPSIQAGIDAARDGDTVLVAPGTYAEQVTLSGKTITLASEFHTTGDPSFIQRTIIDGTGGSAITALASVGPETKVVGFTIQNGIDGVKAFGNLDVLSNIFRSNNDAVDFTSSAGNIRGNLFEDNGDDAIDFNNATAAVIEDNIIRNNRDDGIEIRMQAYTGPTLNIVIRNNRITGNGEDGIQLIDYPELSDRFFLIERNLIQGNAMVGLGLMDNGATKEDFRAASIPETIHVFNNTFADNPYAITGGDSLVAVNNLLVHSTALALKNVDGQSVAAENLFWNNVNDHQGSNVAIATSVFADPLLNSDYRLRDGSPAIDAGTAFFTWNGNVVLDLPAGSYVGAAPDMGMFESSLPAPPLAVEIRVAAGSDDAEERAASGAVLTTSTDLDMMVDLGKPQVAVGMRFSGLAVPPRSTIVSAYLQFQTDEVSSEATSLLIQAQATDAAATFTATTGDISSRARTTASVPWSPLPWTTLKEEGPAQRTPDLSAVIQEIVNRPGWTSGNALALIVTGSGARIAKSYERGAAAAPLLHVDFRANTPPLVAAGADRTKVVPDLSLPAVASLDATVSDDGLPDPPGTLTTHWSLVSGPATVAFGDPYAVDTTVAFSQTGSYVLRLTADDGQWTASDDLTVLVAQGLNVRVSASADDAEERTTGAMVLNSPDLDMLLDIDKPQSAMGMRFNGLTIPPGATIVKADLQFQADEVNSQFTFLTFQAQAADQAAAFAATKRDLSSRPRTAAAVSWAPDPWTQQGEAGLAQRTPNIAAVLQEIIDRPGWTSGNSLALIVTGSGSRIATSYDGQPSAAPLLHVEFTVEGAPPLPFSVIGSDIFSASGLRLVADFNQAVDPSTVQAADLIVDGSQAAVSAHVVDADTIEFYLPTLAAGTHSATIASGAVLDGEGTGLDAYAKSFAVASAPQYTVQHNPRLQPGDAPLVGYAGSELDRVDLLWQTIPGGTGTEDAFSVEYRATGATAWQSVSLNAAIDTGVEGRVVWSATITGLDWNSNYEYRVWHRQADVIVGQYQSTFQTRLAAGDESAFTFVAYGDSAHGTASGFRQVQSRINQLQPSFAVLLGDNVYNAGTHQESDARFSPVVNPEAATWMAGHIDYLGLGNHDIGTSSGLPSEQNFSVPVPVAGVTAPAAPPATERAEHNYSWDYGDVHFVTLDTNSLLDATRLDGLLNWAVADLNASTARWKIVYGHHPLAGVPDKSQHPGGNYYQQVVNRLQAAGADLFMVGHSHTYSWTYPLTGQINGVATYADHGVNDHFHAGEGLPQLVSGVGGLEVRPGDYSQFPFVAQGFTSETPVPGRLGFSQIDVTPDTLTISYVAADNGAVMDSFQIAKEAVQTATFQQGASGYSGTVDTFLHQNTPDTSNATAPSLEVDNDDPAGTGRDAQTLLRFDNLFGSDAGQIPTTATLRTATLQFQVTDGSVNNMNLHRMLSAWSETDTWSSLGGGVQTDGVEAVASPDTSSGQSQEGLLSFNVLASLQAWQTNAANRGWAIVPTGSDGVAFHSSEGTTKPKLMVTYIVAADPNNPPELNTNSGQIVPEGSSGTIDGSRLRVTDPEQTANELIYTLAAVPIRGTVTKGGSALSAGGTFTQADVDAGLLAYAPADGPATDQFQFTVSDGVGGTLPLSAFALTIENVTPTASISGPSTGTVGTPLTLIGSATDPSLEDLAGGFAWSDVQAGDVTGDGRADVVGRTNGGDWWVAVSQGTHFENQYWGYWSPIKWLDLQLADVNGDGRDDVVGHTESGQWWVAKSDGTKFVSEHWGAWPAGNWHDVQVADVNGDWWVAKSVQTQFSHTVWGSWSPITWLDVRAADVTGDSRADLVGRAASGQWWVARANDAGTGFVNEYGGYWSPVSWLDVQARDVTGDGRADLVGRTELGQWWVARANDTGTGFTNESWGSWSPILWHDVRIGDLDGDGRADVVGRTDAGAWWLAKANSTGTGFVNELWGYWSPIVWSDVQLADVNGPDGGVKADLVGRTNSGPWWVAQSTGTNLGSEYWGLWSTGLTFGWTVARDGDPYATGTGANFTFVPGVVGSYEVTLTASDKDGVGTPVTHTITVGSPLLAAGQSPGDGAVEPLSAEHLTPVVEQAIGLWQVAGLDAPRVAALRQVSPSIADLPGAQLGLASSSAIVLDVNAAGFRWDAGAAAPTGPAVRMDLLTAVLHELGHVLGLTDQGGVWDGSDVMFDLLEPGIRRLPTIADGDTIFARSAWPVA